MTIRQRQEAEEQARLSPYAALAAESAGRAAAARVGQILLRGVADLYRH